MDVPNQNILSKPNTPISAGARPVMGFSRPKSKSNLYETGVREREMMGVMDVRECEIDEGDNGECEREEIGCDCREG
jgi:hypothetical protein